MRISEALNLKVKDVDLQNGIIAVYEAKNDNDRLVPITDNLKNLMLVYADKMHQNSCDTDYFFYLKNSKTPIIKSTLRFSFARIMKSACIEKNKNINPRFLAYAVKSSEVINQICSISKGVSYPAIQATILSSVRIPFYALSEQYVIATYLDKECDKITKEIDLLERKVGGYRRMKRSLINYAVMRGLDSKIKTKKSEGSLSSIIPFHWTERRIKDIFTEVSIKGYPNEPMLCATQTRGVIPQSMYENRVVTALTGLENMKLVEEGNFVISLRSFQGGIEYAYYRGIISAAYTILKLEEGQEKGIYKYFFKSASLIKLMKKCVTGIREGQNINYSILKYEMIPVPPLEEQREIVNYLDDKCSKIDSIIEKIKLKIERLKELKRSLINEVITGQRTIKTSDL